MVESETPRETTHSVNERLSEKAVLFQSGKNKPYRGGGGYMLLYFSKIFFLSLSTKIIEDETSMLLTENSELEKY